MTVSEAYNRLCYDHPTMEEMEVILSDLWQEAYDEGARCGREDAAL